MKVYTHGSNINFQKSAREIKMIDLPDIIQPYQDPNGLFGKIDNKKEEIYLFGLLVDQGLNMENEVWTVDYHLLDDRKEMRLIESIEGFVLSQEAIFDVIETEQQVTYSVLFLTFQDESAEETTYFLAPQGIVSEPLAYVAEFWTQTSEVGRDVDFAISGCTAFDFNEQLKAQRK